MTAGRSKAEQGDENGRATIKDLHLTLMELKLPLFSGPATEQVQDFVGKLLTAKLSEENLTFLQELYKLSLRKDKDTPNFNRILKKYIVPDADKELNIDLDSKRKLITQSKAGVLNFNDFIPIITQVNKLITTNLRDLKPGDKKIILDLHAKQMSENVIQELKETRAAMQISVRLNSTLSSSLKTLKNALSELEPLSVVDDNYANKFINILRAHTTEQRLNSAVLASNNRDKSLVDETGAIGERALKVLGIEMAEKKVEQKAKRRLLPSLLGAPQPKPEPDERPKVAANRYLLTNNLASKTNTSKPKNEPEEKPPHFVPPLFKRVK